MSILIKGMEMPPSCGECLNIGWNYVFECDLDDVESGERRFDCPLIPVPPHGRLIDADALYEDCALDRDYEVMATTTRINEYMQLKIDDAPTIIPAEEIQGIQKEFLQNWHEEGSE